VDLSVKLWELPTKMTELGSSGSYLSWASPQLGVEASGHVVDCQLANHPSWVVTPPRDTPLGGASWQGAFPYRRAPWAAVGWLGRKGALLGIWRLQDGGYKWRLFLAVDVSRDTPVHRVSSRNSSAAPGKGVGSRGLQEMRPLVKRRTPW